MPKLFVKTDRLGGTKRGYKEKKREGISFSKMDVWSELAFFHTSHLQVLLAYTARWIKRDDIKCPVCLIGKKI